jgi:hypothetical protein
MLKMKSKYFSPNLPCSLDHSPVQTAARLFDVFTKLVHTYALES